MFFWKSKPAEPERLYLDHAAATPVRPEVAAVMQPFLSGQFANASAIHQEGVAARAAVDQARLQLARTLGVREPEVIFTGSGTESNNLALAGFIHALVEEQHLTFTNIEIIATKLEHPSVLAVLTHLERLGVIVHYAPVDEDGVIKLDSFKVLLNQRTRLVTFAYANSEIGTVQPVKRLARLVSKFNTEVGTTIKVHLDASQAPYWLPCQVPNLGVDLMTLDAGKCGGPKGVGVLVCRGGTSLRGVILGGGQERGLRAGTENVAGIVGAAEAIALAQANWGHANDEASQMSAQLWSVLKEALPNVVLNGPEFAWTKADEYGTIAENRLPNNINISIPGLDSEFAVVTLDAKGVAASTKSACSGAGGGASSVVLAVTGDTTRAKSTIRFSLGPDTMLGAREAAQIAETLCSLCNRMETFDSQ